MIVQLAVVIVDVDVTQTIPGVPDALGWILFGDQAVAEIDQDMDVFVLGLFDEGKTCRITWYGSTRVRFDGELHARRGRVITKRPDGVQKIRIVIGVLRRRNHVRTFRTQCGRMVDVGTHKIEHRLRVGPGDVVERQSDRQWDPPGKEAKATRLQSSACDLIGTTDFIERVGPQVHSVKAGQTYTIQGLFGRCRERPCAGRNLEQLNL